MIIELGFDDIPADYLKTISEKKGELRKRFGHGSAFYLTPRRIVLSVKTQTINVEDVLNFIRCQFREMRWREGVRDSFVRPLRWILALDGDRVLDLEIFGVRSSDFTFTHRAIGNRKIRIGSESEYLSKMRDECKVELSHVRRREKIEETLRNLGVDPQEYGRLVDMAVFTTEFPNFVVADIEVGDIPPKILEKIMTDFVFVFPIKAEKDGRGKLGSSIKGFIAVVDNPEVDEEKVRRGYTFVIKSRVEDAEFYIREDRKIPMSQRVGLLSDVIYNEKFGSFYDRAVFSSSIAEFICTATSLGKLAEVKKAVMLSKADMTTGLFREFPEHQGYIGMFYLLGEGEGEEISTAVYEHKLPERPEDPIPHTEIGKVVSLADKLTHVFISFVTGLPITSEEDPFGIRRSARAALRVMLEGKIDIDLEKLAEHVSPFIREHLERRGFEDIDVEGKIKEAVSFMIERAEVIFSDSFRKDIVRAVMRRTTSPYDAYQRIKVLSENDFYSAFYVARRVGNILEQAHSKGLISETKPLKIKITDDREKQLLDVVNSLEEHGFLEKGKYDEFLDFLSSVREKVDDFFNSLIVLSNNEEERDTRLAILMRLFNKIDSFADFSVIEKPSQQRK